MTLIKQAIADAIRDALIANTGLSTVKAFIRGQAVRPVMQDLYPFSEVIIGEETGGDDLSGGTYERSYSGIITFTATTTQTSGNDWVDVASRKAESASYDTIEALINYAVLELQRDTWRDLGALSVTNTVGTLVIVDAVTNFYLDGPIIYGIDERGQNYENFGSIAFVCETQRTVKTIVTVTGDTLVTAQTGGTLAHTPITADSLVILQAGNTIYSDNALGVLTGAGIMAGNTGTVDYTTGAIALSAGINGALATADYTYTVTVDDESIGGGVDTGTLSHPVIAGTVVFSDAVNGITFQDNGAGVLVGVGSYVAQSGTITYSTGAWTTTTDTAANTTAVYQYTATVTGETFTAPYATTAALDYAPLVPDSLVIRTASETIYTDNSAGVFTGAGSFAGQSGTVDQSNGVVTATSLVSNLNILADYQYYSANS